jgi:fumarylacetoacetate (FAA) hydrolase
MRLVTFVDEKGAENVGIHVGTMGQGRIIAARAAAEALKLKSENLSDILSLIRNENETLPILRQIEAKVDTLSKGVVREEKSTRLISPVPRPVSMRDGYAFRQHVEAARRNRGVPMIPEFDLFPIYYFTNHLAVTGPGELKVRKLFLEKLDFELEVAVVIGKPGRNVRAESADEHVFGYLIMNDWSARWLQMEEMKLNLGPAKGKDFATTLGPYLVTRDELKDRIQKTPKGEKVNAAMKCWVNGKQVSTGNMADMTWTFAQLLERVSYGVNLHSGEVIGSGTVGTGCFLELNGSKITDNQWLNPGDEVVIEVEGLGRLVNTIGVEEVDAPEPGTVSGKW